MGDKIKKVKQMVIDSWKKAPKNAKDKYDDWSRRGSLSRQVMNKRYPAGWSKQSEALSQEANTIKNGLKKGGNFNVFDEAWVKKNHKK